MLCRNGSLNSTQKRPSFFFPWAISAVLFTECLIELAWQPKHVLTCSLETLKGCCSQMQVTLGILTNIILDI